MSDPKLDVGLMVQRVMRYNTTYVEVSVMAREPGKDYPRGITFCTYDMQTHAADVGLHGFVYTGFNDDSKPDYCSLGVRCHASGEIDLSRAKAMVAALTRFAKQQERDSASEHGDVFLALARSVGAKWVCMPIRDRAVHGGAWENTRWAWYGLTDGRNAYRYLIADVVNEAMERWKEREPKAIAAE